MKFLNQILSPLKKFSKGMFALFAIFILSSMCIFIFDSCKKSEYELSNEGEAGKKFMSVLNEVRTKLSSISLRNNIAVQAESASHNLIYCVSFPAVTNQEVINNFSADPTTESLYNVLSTNNAEIFDTLNTSCNVSIQVPEIQLINTLQPLVDESKNYLYAKGVTEQEIIDAIQEEGAAEIDLIPFVKTLIAVEQEQYAIRGISVPFINQANASFLSCGLEALGMAAMGSLLQSSASSWTWATMKSVFKTVAKKFLGPIGVAVAVISFGICMIQN